MAETTQVPDEIQEEYYEPERKERSGVAWLLAIGTLILTVLLATGLFFAGRWTYQQIAGDGGDSGAPAAVENENEPAEEEQVAQGNNNDNSGDNSGNSAATGGNNENNQQRDEEVTNDQDAATNDSGNSDDDETLGTTGDDPSQGEEGGNVAGESTEGNLPSTGPADTAAIFFAVSVFGYFIHRVYLQKS